MKIAAGRARDESDVIELMRANPEQVDAVRKYLKGVHPDYAIMFESLLNRAAEQRDE